MLVNGQDVIIMDMIDQSVRDSADAEVDVCSLMGDTRDCENWRGDLVQ